MPDALTPVEVFYSYAHKDTLFRAELEKHLSLLRQQGLITSWHDRQILPGTDWSHAIDEHLDRASIILLLISADFLASDYCYGIEMMRALERHQAKQALVIPILLRAVDWKGAPFAHLQALPTNAKAITTWDNYDEAFANVATEIRRAVEDLSSLPPSAPLTTQSVRKKGKGIRRVSETSPYHKATQTPVQKRPEMSRLKEVIFLVASILLVLGGSAGLFFSTRPLSVAHLFSRATPLTTVSASASRTPSPSQRVPLGRLLFSDPLSGNDQGRWFEESDRTGSCHFTAHGYVVRATHYYYDCWDRSDDWQDFAFQIQMTLGKGSSGGLMFRAASQKAYYFAIETNGNYLFARFANNQETDLKAAPDAVPGITGPSYLLLVIAKGSYIEIDVNNEKLFSLHDSYFTQGQLVLTTNGSLASNVPETSVTYSNAKAWQL